MINKDRTNKNNKSKIIIITITFLFLINIPIGLTTNNGNFDIIEGPIGYWSFDNQTNIGHDDSGNNHQGINHGATWIADGLSKGGLDFDGVNDYINIPDTSDFEFNNQSITFSCWVQIKDNPDLYRRFILLKGTGGSKPSISLQKFRSSLDDGRIAFEVHDFNGESCRAASIKDGDELPKNKWIFVVGVIDYPNYIKLYLDGELQENVPATTYDMNEATNLHLKIGVTPYGNVPGWHNGLIDEVRIYDRALS